jgi:hypothetical protein
VLRAEANEPVARPRRALDGTGAMAHLRFAREPVALTDAGDRANLARFADCPAADGRDPETERERHDAGDGE